MFMTLSAMCVCVCVCVNVALHLNKISHTVSAPLSFFKGQCGRTHNVSLLYLFLSICPSICLSLCSRERERERKREKERERERERERETEIERETDRERERERERPHIVQKHVFNIFPHCPDGFALAWSSLRHNRSAAE